jgi:hypothetical protein
MLPSECVMPGTTPETAHYTQHCVLIENSTAMAHIWHNEPLCGPLPLSYFQHAHSLPQPTHTLLLTDYFPPPEKLSAKRLNAVKKTAPVWLSSLCQILDIRIQNSKDSPQARSLNQKPASLTLSESIKHQLNSPVQRQKEAATTYSSTVMDSM